MFTNTIYRFYFWYIRYFFFCKNKYIRISFSNNNLDNLVEDLSSLNVDKDIFDSKIISLNILDELKDISEPEKKNLSKMKKLYQNQIVSTH